MRIRARKSRRQSGRITLNLASMIDVTFLLLIYFIQTMIIAPEEDSVSPALRVHDRESAGERSDFQPQIIEVVRVDGQTVFRLGSQMFNTQRALTDALQPLPKDAGVFVRVTDDVRVDHAMAALQAAHDAGFEKVTYDPPK